MLGTSVFYVQSRLPNRWFGVGGNLFKKFLRVVPVVREYQWNVQVLVDLIVSHKVVYIDTLSEHFVWDDLYPSLVVFYSEIPDRNSVG